MISLHKRPLSAAIDAFIDHNVPEGDEDQAKTTEKKLKYCFRVLHGSPTDCNMESLSMEDLLGHMVRVMRVPLIEDHSLFEKHSNIILEKVNKRQKRNARKTLFDFLRFVFQQLISFDELPPSFFGEIDGKQQILWTSTIETYVCPKILERTVPQMEGTNGMGGVIMMETGGSSNVCVDDPGDDVYSTAGSNTLKLSSFIIEPKFDTLLERGELGVSKKAADGEGGTISKVGGRRNRIVVYYDHGFV